MYYIHWLSWKRDRWCVMPADEYRDWILELVYLTNPEAYIDEQIRRDEPE